MIKKPEGPQNRVHHDPDSRVLLLCLISAAFCLGIYFFIL
jgi:hypothetical protein